MASINIMDFLTKESLLVTPGGFSSGGGHFGTGGGMAREEQERWEIVETEFIPLGRTSPREEGS